MARIWQSGAELQSVTAGVEFTTISTSVPSISTTTVRSGSASVRFNPSATTQAIEHTIRGSDDTTLHYYRAYIYLNSAPSGISTTVTGNNTDITIMGLRNAGGYWCELTIDASCKLRIYSDGSSRTVVGTTSNLKLKTWYLVEIGYGSASSYVEGRLNGASFGKTTTAAGLGGLNALGFGAGLLTGESSTSDIFFDDLAVNDNSGSSQISFPGEGKIVHLYPNAAGDSNGFTVQVGGTAGSANNFTRVKEVTPDDATTYNGAALLNAEDLFNCDNFTGGAFGSINVVAVGIRMADLVSGDATTGVKVEIMKTTGGTKSQSANLIPNSTSFLTNAAAVPRNYPLTTYSNPDGGEWTQAYLDSMQIGYINDTVGVQTVAISTVWALIDYTPTFPGTTTSTSSTSTSSTSTSSTSSSISSTSSSTSSTSSSISSTSTSLSTSSTSSSTSSTSSSISSTSSSISSTSTSSTSSSTSVSSTSSSISSTSTSSTSTSSTSSSTSISSTSSSISSTSSSISSTSSSTSSTSTSSTSSSSSTSSTTLPPPYINYSYNDSLFITNSNLTADFELGINSNTISTLDAGSNTPWDTVNTTAGGSIIYDNTRGLGALAVKITQGSPVGSIGLKWGAVFGTQTDHYGRFYLYITAYPAALKDIWFCSNGGSIVARIFMQTSGTLTVSDSTGSGSLGTTINSVPLNRWVRIEYHVVHSTTVGQVEIKLFQTADSTAPTETLTSAATLNTNSSSNGVTFGFTSNGTASETMWLDNILAKATSYPGRYTSSKLSSFSSAQYSGVAGDDGDYFIEYGSEYMIRQYKRKNTNNTDSISFTWKGRSTESTLISPILIQIYNISSATWETLAVANTIPADTDFQATVTQTANLSNYYDSTNTVTFRSYQQVI